MEIKFQTKEESNKAQLEAFLKLTPSERVQSFFRLIDNLKQFPTKKESKNNFIIKINA